MTTERIDEICKQTAYPESHSVMEALLTVWNEMQQDCNKQKSCDGCIHYPKGSGDVRDEPYHEVCGTCSRFYGDEWEKKR